MTITRQSAKQKGAAGEADILVRLQQIAAKVYIEKGLPPPEPYRGRHGIDVRGIPYIAPEVKRHEPMNGAAELLPSQIDKWWEQAKSQAGSKLPVLFYRMNRRPWLVRMYGYIEIDSATRIRCPVDISYEAFAAWYDLRVRAGGR